MLRGLFQLGKDAGHVRKPYRIADALEEVSAGRLILGIGAGIGVAFAIGQLKGTFPTAARLERAVGIPVAGSIRTGIA